MANYCAWGGNMGMTIDEAIYCMECKYYEARNNNTCASSEGHQVAIDTMRKYQKIDQIVNTEFNEIHPLDRNPYKIDLIKEVIKDTYNIGENSD